MARLAERQRKKRFHHLCRKSKLFKILYSSFIGFIETENLPNPIQLLHRQRMKRCSQCFLYLVIGLHLGEFRFFLIYFGRLFGFIPNHIEAQAVWNLQFFSDTLIVQIRRFHCQGNNFFPLLLIQCSWLRLVRNQSDVVDILKQFKILERIACLKCSAFLLLKDTVSAKIRIAVWTVPAGTLIKVSLSQQNRQICSFKCLGRIFVSK